MLEPYAVVPSRTAGRIDRDQLAAGGRTSQGERAGAVKRRRQEGAREYLRYFRSRRISIGMHLLLMRMTILSTLLGRIGAALDKEGVRDAKRR